LGPRKEREILLPLFPRKGRRRLGSEEEIRSRQKKAGRQRGFTAGSKPRKVQASVSIARRNTRSCCSISTGVKKKCNRRQREASSPSEDEAKKQKKNVPDFLRSRSRRKGNEKEGGGGGGGGKQSLICIFGEKAE